MDVWIYGDGCMMDELISVWTERLELDGADA